MYPRPGRNVAAPAHRRSVVRTSSPGGRCHRPRPLAHALVAEHDLLQVVLRKKPDHATARAAARASSVIGWRCSQRFAQAARRDVRDRSRATARSASWRSPAGWHYTAIEASPLLIDVLRKKGLNGHRSRGRRRCRWPTPPPTSSTPIRVLEHMRGIDDARQFTAEALRSLQARRHLLRRRAGLPEGARSSSGTSTTRTTS